VADSILISPPFSLVFLAGEPGFEPPSYLKSSGLASTSSCISIGCLSADDGPSQFKIVENFENLEEYALVFDGNISLPNRELYLLSVNAEVFAKKTVQKTFARICIWTNHSTEPDKIVISLLD
jgi:hypothetical protein